MAYNELAMDAGRLVARQLEAEAEGRANDISVAPQVARLAARIQVAMQRRGSGFRPKDAEVLAQRSTHTRRSYLAKGQRRDDQGRFR